MPSFVVYVEKKQEEKNKKGTTMAMTFDLRASRPQMKRLYYFS